MLQYGRSTTYEYFKPKKAINSFIPVMRKIYDPQASDKHWFVSRQYSISTMESSSHRHHELVRLSILILSYLAEMNK